MTDVCLMTKSMMNPTTLSSPVAAFGHDMSPIVAPVPRKPCSISAENYRRSWPELTLSSSPERRAGQEILSILFSRAAVTSPTGNSIPSASSRASSSTSISPSKTLANRHRFSYDARMVSSSGRMVGAVILHDDDDADAAAAVATDDNDDTTTSSYDDDDDDETVSLHQLHHHHHHQNHNNHNQQQKHQKQQQSSDDSDSVEPWEVSSGTRLESMSPALSSESPSPALLLGVTPPKRADNPLALDRSFFSLASSSIAIGAELGLLNFSPPLRDAH